MATVYVDRTVGVCQVERDMRMQFDRSACVEVGASNSTAHPYFYVAHGGMQIRVPRKVVETVIKSAGGKTNGLSWDEIELVDAAREFKDAVREDLDKDIQKALEKKFLKVASECVKQRAGKRRTKHGT